MVNFGFTLAFFGFTHAILVLLAFWFYFVFLGILLMRFLIYFVFFGFTHVVLVLLWFVGLTLVNFGLNLANSGSIQTHLAKKALGLWLRVGSQ